MFVVVTVVACWLGWQIRLIHERDATKKFVIRHHGVIAEDDNSVRQAWLDAYPLHPEVPERSMEISTIRRLLGDKAVIEITVPDSLGKNQLNRIQANFPEANVGEFIDE